MVVACLALSIALSGVGYATTLQLPKGSVGSPQLQRNAVTPAKLAPDAVRSAHVLDGSLLASDFKPGQIPQGPKGDKGDRGEPGLPGLTEYQVVERVVTAESSNAATVEIPCPAGKRAFGGGAATTWAWGSGPYIYVSRPSAAGTGWVMSLATLPTKALPSSEVKAYAVCARVS
jgi:hypothetical protein